MKTQSRDVTRPVNASLRYSLTTLFLIMTICCIAAAVANVEGVASSVVSLVFALIAFLLPAIFLSQRSAKFVQFADALLWMIFVLMFLYCVVTIVFL